MEYYAIRIKKEFDGDLAWEALVDIGVEVFSSVENEEGVIEIHGTYQGDYRQIAEMSPFVDEVIVQQYEGIDWQQQWEEHGADYHDGFVHIDLGSYGCEACPEILKLKPGPGFGDMSHPTTRLVIAMMAKVGIAGRDVFDVGCGSGVLSLAASAFGANHVWSVDIDEGALEHAEENANINNFNNCTFAMVDNFSFPESATPLTVVMNMISGEQQIARDSLPFLAQREFSFITSGVREEERDVYLETLAEWGAELIEESEEEGWLCFHFLHRSRCS